jgi:hypothetical protein
MSSTIENARLDVDVARSAHVTLPRRRLVLVFAPGEARPWHPDAGVALAPRGDADMRAAATYCAYLISLAQVLCHRRPYHSRRAALYR